MEKKKNGEIEFFRFIFAMLVTAFHFNNGFSLNAFYRGRIGVEFFFIVTGVLLAMSAKKVNIEKKEIPNHTWLMIKRKISSFLPYYIMTLLIQTVFINILLRHRTITDLLSNFLKAIPRLLFFDCFGFRTENCIQLGRDWYLSVMISAIFILLPLLLYNYEWMSKLICPLIGMIGLGSSFMLFGTVSVGTQLPETLVDHLLIRGISNIALGIWAYEIASHIGECKFTKLSRNLLFLLKWGSYILVFIYTYFEVDKSYALIPIILLLIGIILTFSNSTYNIPFNRLTSFLGKLSLPIYLTHGLLRGILNTIWGENIANWLVWIVVLVICPAFAYVFMIITDYIFNQIKKTKRFFLN